MSSALQFEVLDLRHFSAGNLRPLLDTESRVWSDRLHWDYRGSAALLLQYLDSRVLPGYVAVENGRVMGYIFCVYEGHKAVIGDVFALGPDEIAAEVRDELLRHLLELLQNSPGITRIESQLLLHPHGSHDRVFLNAGFGIHERIFMEWPLAPGTADHESEQTSEHSSEADASAADGWMASAGIEKRRWTEGDFAAASRLIAQAYAGHQDSYINEQYRTAQGSHRFLHNIVRFPGCGYFDPDSSWSLAVRGSPELAGLLLCSRVRQDVGHVTQICVAPEYRGRGLATALMEECARNLAKRKFNLLTLTVTASNRAAVSLYERLGFRGTHRFDAMVWDQLEPPPADLFPPSA
jgi:ribosomal protein S18 acetylase RimI-like enzyme